MPNERFQKKLDLLEKSKPISPNLREIAHEISIQPLQTLSHSIEPMFKFSNTCKNSFEIQPIIKNITQENSFYDTTLIKTKLMTSKSSNISPSRIKEISHLNSNKDFLPVLATKRELHEAIEQSQKLDGL
mmetsp:Transcript_24411/g.21662  ORF Transcript_24411/g.21662 Transcript_24411/m.21662 type:complete len:130 (-) Transcript_24411:23-412(-)